MSNGGWISWKVRTGPCIFSPTSDLPTNYHCDSPQYNRQAGTPWIYVKWRLKAVGLGEKEERGFLARSISALAITVAVFPFLHHSQVSWSRLVCVCTLLCSLDLPEPVQGPCGQLCRPLWSCGRRRGLTWGGLRRIWGRGWVWKGGENWKYIKYIVLFVSESLSVIGYGRGSDSRKIIERPKYRGCFRNRILWSPDE